MSRRLTCTISHTMHHIYLEVPTVRVRQPSYGCCRVIDTLTADGPNTVASRVVIMRCKAVHSRQLMRQNNSSNSKCPASRQVLCCARTRMV
jgi:hypothetical protein